MPQTVYEVVWIFIIYAFLGWCTEVAYAALNKGVFVNRGFLNGPYCPIYGCGVLAVVLVLTPLKHNLLILYIGSFLLTSMLEFITGFVMERAFHNKWWDYSNNPFNIMGYVCLKFSILWGLACTFIMLVIHPIIYTFIRMIPYILGVILLCIIMTGFVVDMAVTISAIIKFNKRLKLLNEIAAKLKVVSNQIGENVYENVMEAIEKKEEFEETHAELLAETKSSISETKEKVSGIIEETKEKLSETREKLTEAADKIRLKKEQEELVRRFHELYNRKNRISTRLMRAFPDMKSREHNEILQKIKINNLKLIKKMNNRKAKRNMQ